MTAGICPECGRGSAINPVLLDKDGNVPCAVTVLIDRMWRYIAELEAERAGRPDFEHDPRVNGHA